MTSMPIIDEVAAVSVGIIEGTPMLDLDYEKDVEAEVDMNVVMSGRGLLVEVQGPPNVHRSPGTSSTGCSIWLPQASRSFTTYSVGRWLRSDTSSGRGFEEPRQGRGDRTGPRRVGSRR